MRNVTVHDVVTYTFEQFKRMDKLPISQVQLHKLLWFCNGWHYRFASRPLFLEEFVALKHGPVALSLWLDYYKGTRILRSEDLQFGDATKIEQNFKSKLVLDKVLHCYGQFSATALRELSQRCTPWQNNCAKLDKRIPKSEVEKYFCNVEAVPS